MKKEGRDKYDFLPEDKNQSFLQADSTVFNGSSQVCPKFQKLQKSLQYLKKEGRDEADFLHTDKHKTMF